MKKTLIIFLFQLLSFFLFCNEITSFFNISELRKYEYKYFSGEGIYTGGSDNLVYIWNLNKGILIPRDKIEIGDDGFCFFLYGKEVQIVLFGSNYFYAVSPGSWTTVTFTKRKTAQEYYSNYKDYIKYSNSRESAFLNEYNIKKINSSSAYSEHLNNTTITYNPEYINIFEYINISDVNILQHNPWVPGKEFNASGIGEYLEIEFTKPKDNLVVLNGFVDFDKRYLYKANNRVKKAVITSLDKDNPFEIEYDFEDYVHFSEINFPKAVNKVRFTIKEVYKGEKWDDTCITAVITRWEE